MTRVVHCRKARYDVYIGRPGILGNPFSHIRGAGIHVSDRETAIYLFEQYARQRMERDQEFRDAIRDCYGRTLGCWCKPKDCHGDVIAKLAEEIVRQNQERVLV